MSFKAKLLQEQGLDKQDLKERLYSLRGTVEAAIFRTANGKVPEPQLGHTDLAKIETLIVRINLRDKTLAQLETVIKGEV